MLGDGLSSPSAFLYSRPPLASNFLSCLSGLDFTLAQAELVLGLLI